MKFSYEPGATPIDENEAQGLIPTGLVLQHELNEFEEKNILECEKVLFYRKSKNWLTIKFIRQIHKKMFDQVWKWAGEFRKTNKNLGVDKSQIQMELQKLCDDARYWIDQKTYSIDEIAARFHHRLVYIHPFPNGNGRHARMMTDYLLYYYNQTRFTWGKQSRKPQREIRDQYIHCLKKADEHNIQPLLQFCRS